MKQSEMRQYSKCASCHKPILHGGLPLFWRLRIERFGVDVNAVRRQDALGTYMGNHLLASIMGPDEDMATPVMEAVTVAICEPCAVQPDMCVAAIIPEPTEPEETADDEQCDTTERRAAA